ncbi:unnamed protein product [Closterium sp. Yama58-4]|nr:unnamed protein product [Closterium sp. Yama58-4]
MNRPSFRPRPVDINKKLAIVRSTDELNAEDEGVSRTILPAPSKKGPSVEIPTPHCGVVEAYDKLYPANFRQPSSYIRSKHVRQDDGVYVEYDLDDEDEDWLEVLNQNRLLLAADRLEWMIYQMELLDARARAKAGTAMLAGAEQTGVSGQASGGVRVPVLLQQQQAVDVSARSTALRAQVPRQAIIAAAYDYWRSKRERWGKPILRRLQPSPAITDTNPFNVFRPRERVHRPNTRRMQRRENDMASYEKLVRVQKNIEDALQLAQAVERREERKRELINCEVALQQAALSERDITVQQAEALGIIPDLSSSHAKPFPGATAPPPDIPMPFARPLSLEQLSAMHIQPPLLSHRPPPASLWESPDSFCLPPLGLSGSGEGGMVGGRGAAGPREGVELRVRGRIGRGGRLIFDRWDVMEGRPLVAPVPAVTAVPAAVPALMPAAAPAAMPAAEPAAVPVAMPAAMPAAMPPGAGAAMPAGVTTSMQDTGKKDVVPNASMQNDLQSDPRYAANDLPLSGAVRKNLTDNADATEVSHSPAAAAGAAAGGINAAPAPPAPPAFASAQAPMVHASAPVNSPIPSTVPPSAPHSKPAAPPAFTAAPASAFNPAAAPASVTGTAETAGSKPGPNATAAADGVAYKRSNSGKAFGIGSSQPALDSNALGAGVARGGVGVGGVQSGVRVVGGVRGGEGGVGVARGGMGAGMPRYCHMAHLLRPSSLGSGTFSSLLPIPRQDATHARSARA